CEDQPHHTLRAAAAHGCFSTHAANRVTVAWLAFLHRCATALVPGVLVDPDHHRILCQHDAAVEMLLDGSDIFAPDLKPGCRPGIQRGRVHRGSDARIGRKMVWDDHLYLGLPGNLP